MPVYMWCATNQINIEAKPQQQQPKSILHETSLPDLFNANYSYNQVQITQYAAGLEE